MARLPRLSARQIVFCAAEGRVFPGETKRQPYDLQETCTVPFHAAKILHPKVLRNILRDADLSVEQLESML
jgi:hypothetical protein